MHECTLHAKPTDLSSTFAELLCQSRVGLSSLEELRDIPVLIFEARILEVVPTQLAVVAARVGVITVQPRQALELAIWALRQRILRVAACQGTKGGIKQERHIEA